MNNNRIAFVLASTYHGAMLVNRLDYHHPAGTEPNTFFGVGCNLLEQSHHDMGEVALVQRLLESRREHRGDGVVVYDCGANIGTHTIPWARHMTGWGSVVAIEAQERIFYALCGNIVINNCFNAHAMWGAVGEANGVLSAPVLNHQQMASFGSLELKSSQAEDIGQTATSQQPVPLLCLDSLCPPRVDMVKLDVEGMELEALAGMHRIIDLHHPIIMAEYTKVGADKLVKFVEERGYRYFSLGLNLLAVYSTDPTLAHLQQGGT